MGMPRQFRYWAGWLAASSACTPAPADRDPTQPALPAAGLTTPADSDAAADRVVCTFSSRHRGTKTLGKRERKLVILSESPDDSESFTLHEYRVSVTRKASSTGRSTLQIRTTTDAGEVTEDYDLGSGASVTHLPPGGHGFTGLRYLSHPSHTSELQYSCGSIDRDTDPNDGGASQASPGPSAAAGSTVECTAQVMEGGAAVDSKTFDVVSATAASIHLGRFEIAAQYRPGGHESGGVTLTVGSAAMPRAMHGLYQLHGDDLPTNIIGGTNFTGALTLHDTFSATQLAYSCRTRDASEPGPATQQASPLPPDIIAIPKPRPAGSLTANFSCMHSARPFGTTYWNRSTTFDPAASTIVTTKVDMDEARPDSRTESSETTRLDDATAEQIQTAVQRVLDHGPYQATYPPSEGVSCHLELRADGVAFFKIDRGGTPSVDEVATLINAFVREPGPR